MTTTEQAQTAPEIDVEALERGDLSAQNLLDQVFGAPPSDDSDVDAGEQTDAAPPADAEGGEEQVQGADLEPAIATLGYIDAVIGDDTALDQVPETHRPIVVSAVNAIRTAISNAQNDAIQRGMELGERMAVLDALYRDDPDLFAEEVAKPENRGQEAQYHQWRAMIAQRAGIDSTEKQQIREETGALLGSLEGAPAWRDMIVAEANEQGFKQTPEDLAKLRELVMGARMMIRFGYTSPPNAQAPAGAAVVPPATAPASRPAVQRAQNAQRVSSLPKPDISGSGAKGRPLIDVSKLNESGAGSRLIDSALNGQR